MRSPEGLNANYRGRMVDTHGVRRDSDAVKAMSVNMESPQDRHAIDKLPRIFDLLRKIVRGYADNFCAMQQMMRNTGKKFNWNEKAHEAFENIQRELCEAPVLGIPREMGMCILDPMRWGMKSSPTRFD